MGSFNSKNDLFVIPIPVVILILKLQNHARNSLKQTPKFSLYTTDTDTSKQRTIIFVRKVTFCENLHRADTSIQ